MIKKFSIAFLFIILLAILFMFCFGYPSKAQKISEAARINYNDITKIELSDGRGWNKTFTLEDTQKIKDFIKLLDKYTIKKEIIHAASTGWIHKATFYNGDKKLMSITFTNPLEINNKYYKIVKGQLSTKDIDNFLKSVNPNWIDQYKQSGIR